MSVNFIPRSVATMPGTLAPALGAQPASGLQFQPAGNSMVSTGFVPAPVAPSTQDPLARFRQGIANAQRQNAVASNTPWSPQVTSMLTNQFGQTATTNFMNNYQTASGGGFISDAVKKGVQGIVEWAQTGISEVKRKMNETISSGGTMDPAMLQMYTTEMSNFELITQMAAKIQEKEDNMVRIWLR